MLSQLPSPTCALRQGARPAGRALRARPSRSVAVRAAASEEGFNPVKIYDGISQNIPPILTAGAIPVVALSLLCKSIFGSGLPGPLGLVEGLAWLVLPLGAGTLFPRLVEIAGSPNDAFAILSRDTRGESASERVARITAVTDPSSALGMQLADLAKAKALRAAMSSSERDASDKKNKELAMLAINGVGKGISVSDEAKAAAVGREGLLNQPLGETMKAGMTTENFSKDVASMSDSELMGSQLSKPEMK